MSADATNEIEAAFARRGGEAYGEDVSQLDHALQCAALAAEEGAAEVLIAAALLHDFGHLFEDADQSDDARHEASGARRLGAWFAPAVTSPIALHVLAKRWLCAAEPAYRDGLSDASKASLVLQGGPLEGAARARFETLPFAAEAIRLRRWDDRGKIPGLATPPLASWLPLLRRLAKA